MTTHHIEPNEATLHGYFSKELPPVLTIESGDTVNFRTLDAGWGLEPPPPPRKKFELADKDRMKGHALCGPVYINGAKPGMTLEVQINEVIPGEYGYTAAGRFPHPVNEALNLIEDTEELFLVWNISGDKKTARNQFGQEVDLRPFPGVMGMPPPEEGKHHTAPPRIWGGNLDCKELVAGTTLYLPIGVEGGLFSTGDGHGVQGDGEVSVTAIECPMDRISLALSVREDLPLTTPRARVHGGWITFGLDEDLWQATTIALNDMVDLMAAQYDMSRQHALGMASLVVDMRITQIANGTLGVHAFLPDNAIR